MKFFKTCLPGIISLVFWVCAANAQCPINIGFDFGNFQNWTGSKGTVAAVGQTEVASFTQPGISSDVHTLFFAKDKMIDPYGKFPIVSPNGSSTCVRLGNNTIGTPKAEQLTYTFTIPANDKDYSLIYYYAVVLENPSHSAWQQPEFNAKVFNVTDNQYTACGAFNFVASSNLPGFQQVGDVYYKSWSAVTINLLGYAGKTLRLEFSVNNCTPGGHFGYAYLDVNQNCSSPVSGNTYCTTNVGRVTLAAPSGFQQYYWYNGGDFNTVISTTNTLTLDPAPPVGTSYAVRIVPYPGIGCEDTIYTTIKATEPLVLKVKDTIATCSASGVDLTDSTVTAGSNADFTYTYFNDAALTDGVVGPQNITTSGKYYIEATTPGGCSIAKPVQVYVFGQSSLTVTDPQPVCTPGVVDITRSAVTQGSDPGLTYTYWKDVGATQPLTNPQHISVAGTYYIKGTNSGFCAVVKPVVVSIVGPPNVVVHDQASCTSVSLVGPSVTAGSDAGLTYTYWFDAAATVPLTNTTTITTPGTYYIEGTNTTGCSTTMPVNVTIKPVPSATITDPTPVTFPETVDITATFTHQSGLTYTYWHDAAATIPLADPTKVTRKSTYYIKVDNSACTTTYPVFVNIGAPAAIDFSPNTFTPNGDGVNDVFKFNAPASIILKYFKVYNSWGQLLFETTDINKGWDGTFKGKQMPVGTYYWIYNGTDTYLNAGVNQSGSVSLLR